MEFRRVFGKKMVIFFIFIAAVSAVMYYRAQVKIVDAVIQTDSDKDETPTGTDHTGVVINAEIDGLSQKVDFDQTEVYHFYNRMVEDYRENLPKLGSEKAANQVLLKYFRFYSMYVRMKNDTEDSTEYETYLEQFRLSQPEFYDAFIEDVAQNEILLKYIYENKIILDAAKQQFLADEAYVRNYNKTIQYKRSQADILIKNNLYASKNNFSRLNILKARYDMAKLEVITPEVGNGKAIETVFDYDLIHYLLAILMVITIYAFFDERKKGLWSVIHVANGGRYKLALRRTGILFALSFLYTFFVYMAAFVVAFCLYGGFRDLGQLIQSSQQYEVVLLILSRWEFVLLYLVIHSLCLFCIGMIVWLIMSLIKSINISMLVLVLIFGGEYILYALLSATSSLCVLKYLNLFQMISPSAFITEYLNWGYGSFIVDTFTSTLSMVFILIPITIMLNVFVYAKKRPVEQVGILEKILEKISIQLAKIVEILPAFLKEMYKILFIQRGIIIIAIAAWLLLDNQISRGIRYDDVKSEMVKFYQQAEGLLPGDEMDEIIAKREKELADLIENHNVSPQEKDIVRVEAAVLAEIKSSAEYLANLKEEKGIEGSIMNPYVYEDILGKRLFSNQRNVGLIAVFTVILLTFGIFAFEEKQGMIPILQSSSGRKKVWTHKVMCVTGIVTLVAGILYGMNWWNILKYYTLHSLNEPIQNIQIMGDFPVEMSIGIFLAILILFRFLLLLCIGFIVMAVSRKIKYGKVFIVSSIILVPHLLYILGIKACYLFSVVISLGFTEFWSQYGNNIRSYSMACFIILLGISSYFVTRKNWNHGNMK